MGTNNGISCLTGNGIVNYGNKEGLTSVAIRNFTETSDGRFWISSYGKGIYEFKKGRFVNYKFNYSNDNNLCSQMREYKGWLFIGSEEGLDGLNLTTNTFHRFQVPYNKRPLQGIRFFNWNDELYAQTFFKGIFRVNLATTSLDSVRYDEYLHMWNFSVTQFGDTVFSCRSKYNKKLRHNIFYSLTPDYLKGGKMDSLEISTLVWRMAKTPLGLMAACWGARDDSGGLFLRQGKKMVNVNHLFGISSTMVRDVVYDAVTQKLYVATLDMGLYVIDFKTIVRKENYEEKSDILDLKIIGNAFYILKKDTLSMYEHGILKRTISMKAVERFMNSNSPTTSLHKIGLNAPHRFLDLSVSASQLVINSNFIHLRLDRSLNMIDYIQSGSDGRSCFLKNNDVLIFRAFGGHTELCFNFGKDGHKVLSFWDEGKTNPREVFNFCKLNDSTVLTNGDNAMFVYVQKDTLYKRFQQPGTVNLPTLIDQLGENTFVAVDRLNILYKGKYQADTLLFEQLVDLNSYGVLESYFVKAFKGLVVIATNKGIYIIDQQKTWLVDHINGLPRQVVYRTARFLDNKLYIATSEGIYSISLNQLRSLKPDYTLTNLKVVSDSLATPVKLTNRITYNYLPKNISVFWEVNSHPYPEKLEYSYRLGLTESWNNVTTRGMITINNPNYGTIPVYLRIKDTSNGFEKVCLLVTLYIPMPFYLTGWFYGIIGMVIMAVVYYLLSKRRIKKLKQKANKAEMEARELQIRLNTLQFLLKPHFIFNSLSSIQNLIIKNEIDKSLEYTGYFAKFLRGIMQHSDNRLVTVKEEIDNTLRYIELEKLRFNEGVQVKVKVDPQLNTDELQIIPFLFQPLIENIFKHAFTKEMTNPTIEFSIQSVENVVAYTISDNGKGLNGLTYDHIISKPTSKGIKIIKAQLLKYYPDNHTMTVVENQDGGVSWKIEIFKVFTV